MMSHGGDCDIDHACTARINEHTARTPWETHHAALHATRTFHLHSFGNHGDDSLPGMHEHTEEAHANQSRT